MSLRYISVDRHATLTTSTELNVPDQANYALVDVENQNVRFKGKKQVPTSVDGGLMRSSTQYEYEGALDELRFIEVVAGAAITVQYYRRTSA